jgi:hypothetical protein
VPAQRERNEEKIIEPILWEFVFPVSVSTVWRRLYVSIDRTGFFSSPIQTYAAFSNSGTKDTDVTEARRLCDVISLICVQCRSIIYTIYCTLYILSSYICLCMWQPRATNIITLFRLKYILPPYTSLFV